MARRVSILKVPRSDDYHDEEDTDDETKAQRKVRFSSNYVKEFISITDGEHHTLWDATYEEEIEKSSTSSIPSQSAISRSALVSVANITCDDQNVNKENRHINIPPGESKFSEKHENAPRSAENNLHNTCVMPAFMGNAADDMSKQEDMDIQTETFDLFTQKPVPHQDDMKDHNLPENLKTVNAPALKRKTINFNTTFNSNGMDLTDVESEPISNIAMNVTKKDDLEMDLTEVVHQGGQDQSCKGVINEVIYDDCNIDMSLTNVFGKITQEAVVPDTINRTQGHHPQVIEQMCIMHDSPTIHGKTNPSREKTFINDFGMNFTTAATVRQETDTDVPKTLGSNNSAIKYTKGNSTRIFGPWSSDASMEETCAFSTQLVTNSKMHTDELSDEDILENKENYLHEENELSRKTNHCTLSNTEMNANMNVNTSEGDMFVFQSVVQDDRPVLDELSKVDINLNTKLRQRRTIYFNVTSQNDEMDMTGFVANNSVALTSETANVNAAVETMSKPILKLLLDVDNRNMLLTSETSILELVRERKNNKLNSVFDIEQQEANKFTEETPNSSSLGVALETNHKNTVLCTTASQNLDMDATDLTSNVNSDKVPEFVSEIIPKQGETLLFNRTCKYSDMDTSDFVSFERKAKQAPTNGKENLTCNLSLEVCALPEVDEVKKFTGNLTTTGSKLELRKTIHFNTISQYDELETTGLIANDPMLNQTSEFARGSIHVVPEISKVNFAAVTEMDTSEEHGAIEFTSVNEVDMSVVMATRNSADYTKVEVSYPVISSNNEIDTTNLIVKEPILNAATEVSQSRILVMPHDDIVVEAPENENNTRIFEPQLGDIHVVTNAISVRDARAEESKIRILHSEIIDARLEETEVFPLVEDAVMIDNISFQDLTKIDEFESKPSSTNFMLQCIERSHILDSPHFNGLMKVPQQKNGSRKAKVNLSKATAEISLNDDKERNHEDYFAENSMSASILSPVEETVYRRNIRRRRTFNLAQPSMLDDGDDKQTKHPPVNLSQRNASEQQLVALHSDLTISYGKLNSPITHQSKDDTVNETCDPHATPRMSKIPMRPSSARKLKRIDSLQLEAVTTSQTDVSVGVKQMTQTIRFLPSPEPLNTCESPVSLLHTDIFVTPKLQHVDRKRTLPQSASTERTQLSKRVDAKSTPKVSETRIPATGARGSLIPYPHTVKPFNVATNYTHISDGSSQKLSESILLDETAEELLSFDAKTTDVEEYNIKSRSANMSNYHGIYLDNLNSELTSDINFEELLLDADQYELQYPAIVTEESLMINEKAKIAQRHALRLLEVNVRQFFDKTQALLQNVADEIAYISQDFDEKDESKSSTIDDQIRSKAKGHTEYKLNEIGEHSVSVYIHLARYYLTARFQKETGCVQSFDIDILSAEDELTNYEKYVHLFFEHKLNPQNLQSCIGSGFNIMSLLDYLEYQIGLFKETLMAICTSTVLYQARLDGNQQLLYRYFTSRTDVQVAIDLGEFNMEKVQVKPIIIEGSVRVNKIHEMIKAVPRDRRFPLTVIKALHDFLTISKS